MQVPRGEDLVIGARTFTVLQVSPDHRMTRGIRAMPLQADCCLNNHGTRGTGHRLPDWLMLYNARMAASSSFFSPIPILLNLSRILRIFVAVLIITTMQH